MADSKETQFATRSLAAIHAKRQGFIAFECFQRGKGDGHYWEFEPRKEGPTLAYGLLWAVGKDYVHHIEITKELDTLALITCFPEEVEDEPDELITLVPITPSMLDKDGARRNRTLKGPVATGHIPKFTLRLLSDGTLSTATVNPITGQPLN